PSFHQLTSHFRTPLDRRPPTRSGSELERADGLAVHGFADGYEADAGEELFRAHVARLPDRGQPRESALARFFGERLHREPADAQPLVLSRDVDAPDRAAEVLLLGFGVEVAADEPDDLVGL